MRISQQQAEGAPTLHVAGEITVAVSAELKQQLITLLGSGGAAVVDLTEVTELDVSCLQLLISAQRAWASRGDGLTVIDSPSGIWLETAAKAGLPASEGVRE